MSKIDARVEECRSVLEGLMKTPQDREAFRNWMLAMLEDQVNFTRSALYYQLNGKVDGPTLGRAQELVEGILNSTWCHWTGTILK